MARAVVFVGELAQTRQLKNFDTIRHAEPRHVVRTGRQQDGGARFAFREGTGDGEIAAGVAEAETVVRVEEESHIKPPGSCHQFVTKTPSAAGANECGSNAWALLVDEHAE
jgi:hypothetical protein